MPLLLPYLLPYFTSHAKFWFDEALSISSIWSLKKTLFQLYLLVRNVFCYLFNELANFLSNLNLNLDNTSIDNLVSLVHQAFQIQNGLNLAVGYCFFVLEKKYTANSKEFEKYFPKDKLPQTFYSLVYKLWPHKFSKTQYLRICSAGNFWNIIRQKNHQENLHIPLPISESQLRPLLRLPEQEALDLWVEITRTTHPQQISQLQMKSFIESKKVTNDQIQGILFLY